MSKALPIGFENSVLVDRIIGIFNYDTNSMKRLVADDKASGTAISVAKNKKVKSVILTDSDYTILSAISAKTLTKRLNNLRKNLNDYIDDDNEETD